MKRIVTIMIIIFVLVSSMCVSASKNIELEVSIPTFPIKINDMLVDNVNSEYPFLVYNNITYFPMTWSYSKFLGLSTKWDLESGLRIDVVKDTSNIDVTSLTFSSSTVNDTSKKYKAILMPYKVEVNGKLIDNYKEEYPLILFRNVTYFPLTWRFAVEEFNWKYSWDKDAGLAIDSNFQVIDEPTNNSDSKENTTDTDVENNTETNEENNTEMNEENNTETNEENNTETNEENNTETNEENNTETKEENGDTSNEQNEENVETSDTDSTESNTEELENSDTSTTESEPTDNTSSNPEEKESPESESSESDEDLYDLDEPIDVLIREFKDAGFSVGEIRKNYVEAIEADDGGVIVIDGISLEIYHYDLDTISDEMKTTLERLEETGETVFFGFYNVKGRKNNDYVLFFKNASDVHLDKGQEIINAFMSFEFK